MSDSFPPEDEGPDPYEGQDFDGLLSGENCSLIPEALRPVVPALDALRAAPMRGELHGEAAVRAYFRQAALASEARTLIVPTVTPGGAADAAGSPHRPHRHRRPSKRGRWRAKALAGAAAAAVVIAGVAVAADTLSGAGGRPAAGRSHQAVSATTSATVPGANVVEGNGTPEPTVKPTPNTETSQPSRDNPSPSELCDEYSDFFTHPARHSLATKREVFKQLSSLAGGADDVEYYCMRLIQPWAVPRGPRKFPAMHGYPFSAAWPGSHDYQGSQRSQVPGFSVGHSGGGNDGGGGNGNGQGGDSGGAGTGASGRQPS
ncbi:MAG: hypothetical protein ACRDNW_21195 [Trebonia sp.]